MMPKDISNSSNNNHPTGPGAPATTSSTPSPSLYGVPPVMGHPMPPHHLAALYSYPSDLSQLLMLNSFQRGLVPDNLQTYAALRTMQNQALLKQNSQQHQQTNSAATAAAATAAQLQNKNSSPVQGLDLLGSAATTTTTGSDNSSLGSSSKGETPTKSRRPVLASASEENRTYIPDVSDLDVLCGRGGRSNHHLGNKKYRQVVSEMKDSYRSIGTKSAKTNLSRAIVERVYQYGGRFVKHDKETGQYYVLSVSEARKKTSQALREAKEVKWTA